MGSGTFPAAATPISVGSNARGPSVGDWNADGIPDLALVNNNAIRTVSILTGKGNGNGLATADRIQELHMLVLHTLVEGVEMALGHAR